MPLNKNFTFKEKYSGEINPSKNNQEINKVSGGVSNFTPTKSSNQFKL